MHRRRGGVGKTTTTVGLPAAVTAALGGGRLVVDIDSGSTSGAPLGLSAEEFLRLVTDLVALTGDPADDPVIRGLIDAREQLTDHAREAATALRSLSEEELERLGPGEFLPEWVVRLQEALADAPQTVSGRLLGAADTATRMEAIEEAAREVGNRTTAPDSKFLDGSPASRQLLAALGAVEQLRLDLDALHVAIGTALERRAELTADR
ncbi:hypothetical protein AB0C84_42980 [Actinomadura sp. NPDC048955]|uniref:hypothetical protein n=1 Tax=Actinomadura sp. NPDC048955 TaxID=3158228 RepID=UPI0033EFDF4C